MKKVMMMAMMLVASATAFAGKSDALKAITKCKDYKEAAQLLKNGFSQLADNAEKAEAYNHLFKLAMKKVDSEGKIIDDNQTQQIQGGKVEQFDTLGLCDNLILSIENALECKKYDEKEKYSKDNAKNIWDYRKWLMFVGDNYRMSKDLQKTLKYWTPYLDSYVDPLFDKVDKIEVLRELEKDQFEQVAYLASYCACQLKDAKLVNKFAEMVKDNEKYKDDLSRFKVEVLQADLKTKEDSLNCIKQLKQMYESNPTNDIFLEGLSNFYGAMNDKAAQTALLDNHLAKYPNSFTALADKGIVAMNDRNFDESVKWLRKACEAKPDNAIVWTYLGMSLNVLASNATDNAVGVKYFDEAIAAFNKAKQLDPKKQLANWGYHRYQAYYGRYGADAPETKDAELDTK